MIDKATFPSINSLAEITKNGFYRMGNDVVKADCIGDPDFIACQMAPVTITGPNMMIKQVFIDHYGKGWCRVFESDKSGWSTWIDIDEITAQLNTVRKQMEALKNGEQHA